MKRYIRSGVLALSLSALPLTLSASAQTGGYQGYEDRNATTSRSSSGNWGWLGLIGLFGLLGLRHRREDTTRHRAGDYRTGEPLGSR
ncbi:MAG: WGxxGxxG family protein [Blastocatellales bacterium]